MNRKQLAAVLSFTILLPFLSILPAHSAIPEIDYVKQPAPTEKQLSDLAVEKGIIPPAADRAYLDNQINQNNTITTWILASRESKIKLIDQLKKIFKDKENVTIKLPDSYYVDEVNGVLYNSIKNGDIDESKKRGLGVTFVTIAMMDGDYDSGKNSRVEELRKHMGEEMFNRYKKEYPEKYEYLFKLDKQGTKDTERK